MPLTPKHRPLKLACFSLAFLATSCATTEPTPPPPNAAKTAPLTLTYTKGQLISLIIIDAKDGEAAAAARANYYDTAFPMATPFGLKRDAGMTIAMTMVGKFKPEAVGIFSWPSQTASDELSAQSGWPAIKATRPAGWDELAIFTAPITQDMALTFDPAKAYTIAVAYINSDNPADYDRYMAGIEPSLNGLGGRFIYRMINPVTESHRSGHDGNVQVTLVEWDSADLISKFTSTSGYKANADYFASGITGFEFHQIVPAQ